MSIVRNARKQGDKIGTLQRASLLAPLFVLALACIARGQDISHQITTNNPVQLELPTTPQARPQNSRLVLSVKGYEPSTSGSVSAVVLLQCQNKQIEIGRFAIFPNARFTPQQPGKQQNFGIPLPSEADCQEAKSITISLQPTIGHGTGASITLGALSME